MVEIYNNAAIHKMFLDEVVLTQRIDIMSISTFDEVEIYKYAIEHNLLGVIRYLIKEHWNIQFIEISIGDQDLLLDILDIYPSLFYKLEPYLQKWAIEYFLN